MTAQGCGERVVPGGAAGAGEADPVQACQCVQPDPAGLAEAGGEIRGEQRSEAFLDDQHGVQILPGGAFAQQA
ncbi:hypothetical protein PV683_41025 [Streptomyces sp. AK08-01B]|nr:MULTISPECIES: hypothetical protein [unclassified Streptomyces]MDX3771985.1 hypothetical protein [Streptomyces sp. AK08-01B]MDX3821470.1 hypothetical protein [Streptomyces sp. AK08-01A]